MVKRVVSKKTASPRTPAQKTSNEVEARLCALESQVATLIEAQAQRVDASNSGDERHASSGVLSSKKFWLIDKVLRDSEAKNNEHGGVAFGGQVLLPTGETYAWQVENNTNDLLATDWSVANAALTALAHPIRLQVLKALFEGKRDTQSLATLPEMGTTGQLYHHLKELEAAGWIRQPRRGEYIVLAERVVPLLAILAACEVTKR
jgi:DNA-binding transcriptional ArsR family regulator